MKIAVLSDTHGNWALALKLLDFVGECDKIIHLGDTCEDAEIIELALERKLEAVSGNCDHGANQPRRALLNITRQKIFMTHGDQFHVKSGLDGLFRHAKKEGADIVLYGHTHIPGIEVRDGILFINPGTLKDSAFRKSLAVLHLEGDETQAEIIDAAPPQMKGN